MSSHDSESNIFAIIYFKIIDTQKCVKKHARHAYNTVNGQATLYICRSSVCESHVNEVGGLYWVEKGHMVPEAMGGQASDSICHGV